MEYLYDSDLLTIDAQIIAQQCNCVTTTGKGLSAAIAAAFPHADVYLNRPNPSIPGTIEVRGDKDHRFVLALYAQYYPGGPRKGDTSDQRVSWFRECLDKVGKIKNLRHIAFPECIGCGLAQGDWEVYHGMLVNFSEQHPKVKVTIVSKSSAPKDEISDIADINYTTMSLVDYTQTHIPAGWEDFFTAQLDPEFGSLGEISEYLEKETEQIFPPLPMIYTMFNLVRPEEIRVLILGQDPFHNQDQAMGIAFSVGNDIIPPPSLKNIFKELESTGFEVADQNNGELTKWCNQKVFLINTALSVRAHTPKSHSKKWLDAFTPSLLRWMNDRCEPMVIILWGNDAQALGKYFGDRHRKIQSVHPSPLSASRGFFGSDPFNKANKYLKELGRDLVDWSL